MKTLNAVYIAFAALLLLMFVRINCNILDVKNCACNGPDSLTRRVTHYGMMQAKDTIENTMRSMQYAGINIVRAPIYFYKETRSNVIDTYLAAGFDVQINFNYKPTGTTVEFPTDTNLIREKAIEFFEYYKNRRDQIPFVAIENEWDNEAYHENLLVWYVQELNVITRIAHNYGFKVSDAGITGNNLQRWTYSQLDSARAETWKQNYYVGLDNDYEQLVNKVNRYFAAIVNTDIDFINFHWYNTNDCPKGLPVALGKMPQKFKFVTNEWGVKAEALYDCTLNEMRAVKPVYCIVYSGVNEPGKAIRISDDNLKQMSETIP